MKAKTQYSLMSSEERDEVKQGPKVDISTRDGLLGQFPEITKEFESRMALMKYLFRDAEENIKIILGYECFSGFQDYQKNQKADSLVAHNLNEIIEGKVRASQYTYIWSANQYDNRGFKLILHEGKLKLCIHEYIHQDEHVRGGIHWYRIIEDQYIVECDSYRLHQILTILADPETAWIYLRARVYTREYYLNHPQH